MNITTFDKLAYIDSLKVSGISSDQVRAHAKALDDALKDSIVTRLDLKEAISPIEARIIRIEVMVAFIVAVNAIPLIKYIIN